MKGNFSAISIRSNFRKVCQMVCEGPVQVCLQITAPSVRRRWAFLPWIFFVVQYSPASAYAQVHPAQPVTPQYPPPGGSNSGSASSASGSAATAAADARAAAAADDALERAKADLEKANNTVRDTAVAAVLTGGASAPALAAAQTAQAAALAALAKATVDAQAAHAKAASSAAAAGNSGQASGAHYVPPPSSSGQGYVPPPSSSGQGYVPPPSSGGHANVPPPNTGSQGHTPPPNTGTGPISSSGSTTGVNGTQASGRSDTPIGEQSGGPVGGTSQAGSNDQGAHDPEDFPRPPDTERTEYSLDDYPNAKQEQVEYNSSSPSSDLMAFYTRNLPPAGWKKEALHENNGGPRGVHQFTSSWVRKNDELRMELVDVQPGLVKIKIYLKRVPVGPP
jgi:hypothetical protein